MECGGVASKPEKLRLGDAIKVVFESFIGGLVLLLVALYSGLLLV
jgi:hypothetical protein